MPVNSIAQMMRPAHLQQSPAKHPAALALIKATCDPSGSATGGESVVPELKTKNGVGHFVLPLQRIHFTYCSHCGDSDLTRYICIDLVDFNGVFKGNI